MRVAQATNALFPVMMEILDFKITRWFEKHEPHLAGFERLVRVDCERLHLAVTEGAPLVMTPSFYGALRLEPMRADVCVVKSFLPFRLYVAFENREAIDARNLGLMDFGLVSAFEGVGHALDEAVLGHEAGDGIAGGG